MRGKPEDVTKLQRAWDERTAETKAWNAGLKQGNIEGKLKAELDETALKLAKARTEIDQRNKAVKMLMQLVERYGFCREEMQVARMDLNEAHEMWMGEVDIDGKNLGAFSHWVLQEMKRNGEL